MNCRRGCILIYNHFMGDYLNNDMAQELLALEGIPSIQVPCRDDCFSAPGADRSERTGLTGILYMIRIASMCASSGMGLPEMDANRSEGRSIRISPISSRNQLRTLPMKSITRFCFRSCQPFKASPTKRWITPKRKL